MKVLILCPRSDLAGVGIGIKQAFDGYSRDWQVRVVRAQDKVYDYPKDAGWAEKNALVDWADLVHVMEIPAAMPRGKKLVLHHHGSYFRWHRTTVLSEQRHRGAVGIVSTIDLLLLAPDDLTWIPAPYDVDWLYGMRRRHPRRPLRIVQCPTNRVTKNTDALLAAAERLSKDVPVEVDIVEGVTWAESLRRKADADIVFDQLLTGYGNNAVEAMAMGIPVIAGLDPELAAHHGHPIPHGTQDEMLRRFGGLPYVSAHEESVYEALVQLVDVDNRAAWGARGLAHVRKFHDQPVVVRQLEQVYLRA